MFLRSLSVAFAICSTALAVIDPQKLSHADKAALIQQAMADALLEYAARTGVNPADLRVSATPPGGDTKMLRREANLDGNAEVTGYSLAETSTDKSASSGKTQGAMDKVAAAADKSSRPKDEQSSPMFYSSFSQSKVKATPTGHTIPFIDGHWQWDNVFETMVFTPNGGLSQGRLDPPGSIKKGLGTSADMVKAVDVKPGVKIDFEQNSVNNEKTLRDAEYFDGGRWEWSGMTEGHGAHPIPVFKGLKQAKISPMTKYYHSQWLNATTHMKSAFEPDFFRDNRRGNVAVGPGQYMNHASNSVISGRENNVRGNGAAVLGGEANLAKRSDSLVAGGVGNVAAGLGTEVTGGYHNQAIGRFSTVIGGAHNSARGPWSGVGGGYANIAEGALASVTGGSSNRAKAQLAVIHGGKGNKALAPLSVVNGGEGGQTRKRFQILTGVAPASDKALNAAMDAMEHKEKKMEHGEQDDSDSLADSGGAPP